VNSINKFMQSNYTEDEEMFNSYIKEGQVSHAHGGRSQFIPKSRAKSYLKYALEENDSVEYFPELGSQMKMEGHDGVVTVVNTNEKNNTVNVELEDGTRVMRVNIGLLSSIDTA